MASIIQIKGKWRALIRRAGRQSICKTHTTKAAAVAWARQMLCSANSPRHAPVDLCV